MVGGAFLATTSAVMTTLAMSSRLGRSNITGRSTSSMMARRPRAPVPRSSAWSAMVLSAVELEHLLVLLDEGVLRRGQDLDERRTVQVRDGRDDGQAADEFRDQAEFEQVLRHDLAVGIRGVLD